MNNMQTILIVEDNQLNLDMARELLQRAGFQTLEAFDAETGILLAKEHHPALILMDMHLPVKNGYEATDILKSAPDTHEIPVVAFTALAMEEDKKKAQEHGCCGSISKPIDVDHFAETITTYLNSCRLERAESEQPVDTDNQSDIETLPPSTRLKNLHGYKVLIVDDNVQNLQLLGDILRHMNQPYISARNGREALYLAKQENPALILLDILMPDLNGFQVLEHLQADPKTADISVIFISALNQVENIAAGLNRGGYDYIMKPIHVEEVQARVLSALRARKLHDDYLKKAEEAEKAKEDLETFLFLASHDLSAPLRKIQQFANFLKQSPHQTLNTDNQTFVEGISRNASDIADLLQDLLTLSRTSRKGDPFQLIELEDVIHNVLLNHQRIFRETGAKIEVGEMVCLEADLRQMEEVFNELVDNALKFRNSEKAPYIRITSRNLDHETCEISIQDNGIGFSEEHNERIFQPLKRLHGTSQYSGKGMGLAIVKKIIERHHGSITANSTPGKDTVFTIRLPRYQKN